MAAVRFGPVAATLALGCAGLVAWLALQHPLSPLLATMGVVVAATTAVWRPFWVPTLLIALLPVAGLAPWTGWMLVEEFDLLLLALLAGGWARLAWPAGLPPRRPAAVGGAPALWALIVVAFAAAAAVGVWVGLADAGAGADGTPAWGWWQGWREPMNVLRTAKPVAWVLLAWPLWQALQAREPEVAARSVGRGAWGGLAMVSAVAAGERWMGPGLANFGTEYRTTALFWEAHIGGAALDGFLALTLPFGLWAAATARSRAGWWASMAVLALAAYAVLTTFSRGLYVGAVAGVVIWWALRPADSRPGVRPWVPVAWCAAFLLAAVLIFPGSGWRGLAAAWMLLALAFLAWQRGLVMQQAARTLVLSAAAALPLAVLAVAAALALPGTWKGPYLLFGGLAMLAAAAWWAPGTRWRLALGLAGWTGAAVAAVGVAWHWGGAEAGWAMAGAAAGLAALVWLGLALPAWRGPPGGRWRVATLAAMAVAGIVVGSVAGGDYLRGRLATSDEDFQGRQAHWARALALAADAPFWGIGSGRFAAHFAFSGEATDQTGDYRWQPSAGGAAGGVLVLTAGRHTLGFGEVFRISQRIPAPVGEVTLRWRAHLEGPAGLHAEICNKHLLYDDGCSTAQAPLAGTPQAPAAAGWREGRLILAARQGWTQPVFSIAIDTPGSRVVFDRIEATDASGRTLLANGGFDRGLARWLPSSDRHHMPWHAKNMGLHLRVEQGWLGAAAFVALLGFAVVRLAAGRLRRHDLAPPLLAAIVGFCIVGLFDSLLDVPRVAFALLWLLGVAATLRSPAPRPPP